MTFGALLKISCRGFHRFLDTKDSNVLYCCLETFWLACPKELKLKRTNENITI